MNQINKIVGVNLKELRLSRNLKLEDLAIILSISKSAYYRIENGFTNLWTNIIFKAKDYFEVNLSDFFIEEGEIFQHDKIVDKKKQRDTKQKLELLKIQIETLIKTIN